MAYSDFTIQKIKRELGLQITEHPDLFGHVPPMPSSDRLTSTLNETIQLAIAINTEKARSELIIAPVLLEIRRQSNYQISLFSGNDFNVDEERGLVGYCDYLISHSPEQLTINAPVMVIIEAKNENIKNGLGQCLATMYAAQLFNQQEATGIATIYGAVTTGEIWKFLKLTGEIAAIDLSDYYISRDVDKILGILAESIGFPSLTAIGQ